MSQDTREKKKPEYEELTAAQLNRVEDHDKPSFIVFWVSEIIEWSFYIIVVAVILILTKPIWEPVYRFISSYF